MYYSKQDIFMKLKAKLSEQGEDFPGKATFVPRHHISKHSTFSGGAKQMGSLAFGYYVPLQQEHKDPHSVQLCYMAALQHL